MPENHLKPQSANFTPLSPLSFLRRSRDVYPDRPAVIYGDRRYSWAEAHGRCVRLANALTGRGVQRGDTVSIIAANTPELFEAHFGIPMAGAVLNTINTRLDPETIAYILEHGETKVLIADTQFSPAVKEALTSLGEAAPQLVEIVDPDAQFRPGEGERLGELTYEDLLAEASEAEPVAALPADEWDTLALNYTSGTSGRPKGVLYHHPRFLPHDHGNHRRLGAAAAPYLPLHSAHVPLQWLGPCLDYGSLGGHGSLLPLHHGAEHL